MISLALLLAAAAADPVGPGLQGQVQCYRPNPEQHSCVSIGAYARDANGVIQNTATVLLAPKPVIVMRSTAPVEVKAGAICGKIAAHDLEIATFTVDGRPADDATAAKVRQAIAPVYAPLLGREVCTTYVPDGETLWARASVDGVRRPDLDARVRWVSPSEGYEVKP